MSQGRRSEHKLERVTRLEQRRQAGKVAPSQHPADLDAAGRLAHLAEVFKRKPVETPVPAPTQPAKAPEEPATPANPPTRRVPVPTSGAG
jgi:hypothetical protein